jgi:peptide/nickel transport system ATP-binding protein
MSNTVLQVEDLTVSYPSPRGRFRAVDGVSFTIHPGETFGLVGESGSGKTTTAMAILNMIKPPARVEHGRILLEGVDLLAQRGEALRRLRWSRLSFIPQGAQNALSPVMKITDQIGDAITSHEGRQPRRQLRRRIADLLESVGLPAHVAEMYPHELSGGMKQRVCIAMAIALSPQLIVADEPTSALDVVVQRVVAETLKAVQARLNAALLLIGHDMGLQAQLVDHLGVMYGGRLVEVGAVRDIFKNPVHPYTQRLIASSPSIKQRSPRAAQASAGAPAPPAPLPDAPCALREVRPGHFVALPDREDLAFPDPSETGARAAPLDAQPDRAAPSPKWAGSPTDKGGTSHVR